MSTRKRLPANERKKEIRNAAKTIFLEKGFHNTTMEDVIKKVGLSKGGVYRHYKSTSDMLYDLMYDGNNYRYKIVEDFIEKNTNIPIEELIVESCVLKMIDTNEYKSLYSIFLIESEKNSKLRDLKIQITDESKNEFVSFLREKKLSQLECLVNDEWIAFMNSIIVATENLSVRDIFLDNKDFFKNIILTYIKNNNSK